MEEENESRGTAVAQLPEMAPEIAFGNLANVVEAFVGNATAHRLLAQSLQVVRMRLLRADELERMVNS